MMDQASPTFFEYVDFALAHQFVEFSFADTQGVPCFFNGIQKLVRMRLLILEQDAQQSDLFAQALRRLLC